jgi:hypothetical protein
MQLQGHQQQYTILSRKHLFELCIRNGFYLPQLKSSLCNYDYLCGVKEGKIFCPKSCDLRIRICFTPPTKQAIIIEIVKLARSHNQPLNLGFDEASK